MVVDEMSDHVSKTTQLRGIGAGAQTRAGRIDGAVAAGRPRTSKDRERMSENEGPKPGQTWTRAAKLATKRTREGIDRRARSRLDEGEEKSAQATRSPLARALGRRGHREFQGTQDRDRRTSRSGRGEGRQVGPGAIVGLGLAGQGGTSEGDVAGPAGVGVGE